MTIYFSVLKTFESLICTCSYSASVSAWNFQTILKLCCFQRHKESSALLLPVSTTDLQWEESRGMGTYCSGLETEVLWPSMAMLLLGLLTTWGLGGRTYLMRSGGVLANLLKKPQRAHTSPSNISPSSALTEFLFWTQSFVKLRIIAKSPIQKARWSIK